MKVKELIERLQAMPQDMEVRTSEYFNSRVGDFVTHSLSADRVETCEVEYSDYHGSHIVKEYDENTYGEGEEMVLIGSFC